MTQLFRRRATRLFRAGLLAIPLAALAAAWLAYALPRSDYAWRVGQPAPQPVPFSHDHHVGGLGIHCRYCHTSVERAAFAGMPPAETCMGCHAEVWSAAAVLAPIESSVAFGEPVLWQSVHRLPEFTYFHHGIHIAKGVGCETCHGRVDLMRQTVKAETLSMGWCLDCHRDPEPYLRPADAIYAMGWAPAGDEPIANLTEHYGIAVGQLTDCSVCHR
jgi:hypothetical protein